MNPREQKKPKQKPDAPLIPPEVDSEAIRRENRFAEIEKAMGKVWEDRLRGLFLKWGKPEKFTLTKAQEEELFSHRIILPVATASAAQPTAPVNDTCYSLESLAGKMRKHYTNPDGSNRLKITITKRVVSEWGRGHGLGKNNVETPGPMTGTKTKFSLKAWLEWFDKNLLAEKIRGARPAQASNDESQDEDPIKMEQDEKRDAIKHRQWERAKDRGEYVHRSIALSTGIAAVKRLHLMVKQEDERGHTKLRREKLLEIGVPLELVETFSAWDKEQMRLATDRRETEMASAGIMLPEERKL